MPVPGSEQQKKLRTTLMQNQQSAGHGNLPSGPHANAAHTPALTSQRRLRRDHLRQALRIATSIATGIAGAIAMPAIATTRKSGCIVDDTTALRLHHLHTGERLTVRVQLAGKPMNQSGQLGFDRFARDHYNGRVLTMDPGLVQLLATVQHNLGCQNLEFEVVSGYRSPVTNQRLLRLGRGVDRNSFHMRGQAIDVRMWGVPLASIRDAALELQAGGVGYYPRSSFVHIDTGPVRRW